ncbi:MAG: hypothetical protein N2508_14470 [Anaerolineae bacterium]|nr:hypothetical protein [Anaerolineae bacterium]
MYANEKTIRIRQARALARNVALVTLTILCFCTFITALFGVPQSFIGQWWIKPPRYPNAVLYAYEEGTICHMPLPATYCYEWYYRTSDSAEKVIAYYENLHRPLHAPIRFEWRRGARFGISWVAEDNVRILSTVCGYQIIVHPSPDGDTEIYILERGAMGTYGR